MKLFEFKMCCIDMNMCMFRGKTILNWSIVRTLESRSNAIKMCRKLTMYTILALTCE